MRHPVSKDLYAYWNRLRGARSAPDRSDIDPAAIRHVLADSFIIEIDPACVFPIRLCGTRLNALRMTEQKGRSFLDLWQEEDRRSLAAALLTVIDGVTPIVAGAKARAPIDASWNSPLNNDMSFELLLLPLRHFGKTHSRLLGSLSSSDQVDWFGRAVASPLELASLRVIRLQETAKVTRANPADLTPLPIGRRIPKLVVYEGGKSRLQSGIL